MERIRCCERLCIQCLSRRKITPEQGPHYSPRKCRVRVDLQGAPWDPPHQVLLFCLQPAGALSTLIMKPEPKGPPFPNRAQSRSPSHSSGEVIMTDSRHLLGVTFMTGKNVMKHKTSMMLYVSYISQGISFLQRLLTNQPTKSVTK